MLKIETIRFEIADHSAEKLEKLKRTYAGEVEKLRSEMAEQSAERLERLKRIHSEEIEKIKSEMVVYSNDHVERIRKQHGIEIEEYRQKLIWRDSKYRENLERLKTQRIDRDALIQEIREQIITLVPHVEKATHLTPLSSPGEVISTAIAVFTDYAAMSQLMLRTRGKISRTHYIQLEKIQDTLFHVCLDMALDPSEREDPKRLQRFAQNLDEIEIFARKADGLFESIMVPRSSETKFDAADRDSRGRKANDQAAMHVL